MGRVNLDQLELIKDQESSCDEEEERDVMEMAENENVARPEDAEEEEEVEEEEAEEEEERGVMESTQVERGMDDEEMEGFGEEEEEQEEEVEEEEADERHPPPGRPIGNRIIYSIFLLSSTSWNRQFIQTLFPRSPWVSHQHLGSERRGEAAPLRVLRPLLHQQPGVGTPRPAPRHVSVFARRTRRSGLFPVFPQTSGAFSWVCVCGRIPDVCVRGTAVHRLLTVAPLLRRQGGEHRPDGHQHRRRALGSVFRRFFRRRGRGVGAARQPKRGGGVLAGKPERVRRRRREARHQKGSRV